MGLIKKIREFFENRHRKFIANRAEQVFTISDYKGELWFYCNGIGLFPCYYVGKETEKDIMDFLNDMRQFYISNE